MRCAILFEGDYSPLIRWSENPPNLRLEALNNPPIDERIFCFNDMTTSIQSIKLANLTDMSDLVTNTNAGTAADETVIKLKTRVLVQQTMTET